MSGHSKWAQIKRKKAVSDAKRGKIFSKLSKQIAVAAREKGVDPEKNPRLKTAIAEAYAANMPKENVKRAIERASGKGGEGGLEELMLEAYGPGGVALIITAITDNKNRTLAEIRHILNEHGGKLAGGGSVQWLFEQVGVVIAEGKSASLDALELAAIEAGAIDTQRDHEGESETIVVTTDVQHVERVKKTLEEKGGNILKSSLDLKAKDPLAEVDEVTKRKIESLFEALDEHNDTQSVYDNLST